MYQIYKDNVVFSDYHSGEIEKIMSIEEVVGNYPELRQFVSQSRREFEGFTDYSYTDFCVGCDKYDNIVQGFCKPCWDMTGLEYES